MAANFSMFDRDCQHEQLEPLRATVSGNLPAWLNGSLLLNGPGRMKYGEQEFNHVFDGSAILQKINFDDGGVTYTSKFLKSYAYLSNTEHGKIVVSEFGTKGTPTSKGALSKIAEKFQYDKMVSDNAPVTVASYGGQFYATTEAPFLHRIDPDTLDTLEKIDLHKLHSAVSSSPHPLQHQDGSTYNVLTVVGATGPKYEIVRYPAQPSPGKASVFEERAERVGLLDARWRLNPCYLHTWGLTPGHVLVPEQPLTVDVTSLITNTFLEKPVIEGIKWLNDHMTKLRVVSLKDGKEVGRKYKTAPFFYIHIINCFEDRDHILMDIVTYQNTNTLRAFLLKNIREKGSTYKDYLDKGAVKRFAIPLNIDGKTSSKNLVDLEYTKASAHMKDGTVILEPEIICNTACEGPVINPKNRQNRYQYVYGLSGDLEHSPGHVMKLNVDTSDVILWKGPADLDANQVTFVPRPGAEAEDDGVLLVWALPSSQREAVLVVLEARTLREEGRVSLSLPSPVPQAMHAIYRPRP